MTDEPSGAPAQVTFSFMIVPGGLSIVEPVETGPLSINNPEAGRGVRSPLSR